MELLRSFLEALKKEQKSNPFCDLYNSGIVCGIDVIAYLKKIANIS